jgi:hypothetical protein
MDFVNVYFDYSLRFSCDFPVPSTAGFTILSSSYLHHLLLIYLSGRVLFFDVTYFIHT